MTVVLYTTLGCHLCDQARDLLLTVNPRVDIHAVDIAEDDTLIEINDVAMVVDPLSYQYLVGSTVDFEEGLAGARFLIKNPNASSTCGCGASFMV